MDIEFEKVMPGVYGPAEADLLRRFKAELDGTGPHVPEGMGPARQFTITADSKTLLEFAYIWNRYNPLYTDVSYAEKSPFRGQIAAPWAVISGSSFPYLPKKTGVWVSAYSHLPPKGLDHEYTFHRPIYAGDILHTETTLQGFEDITPPTGGDVRLFRMLGEGNLVNHHGEVVISAKYRGVEPFHVLKNPDDRFHLGRPEYLWPPFTYDWSRIRPQHVYTPEDWEKIRDIWSKEVIRGAQPRYWEDVQIGDEPPWTCDGPITHAEYHAMIDEVFDWYGMKQRVQRPRFTRDMLTSGDTEDLFQDPYGMWQSIRNFHDEGCNVPNARASCMNTDGRNFATRMVTNWMGDTGWIYKGCWRLSFGWDEGYNMFPADCDRPSYLLKVPYLREQGKFMNTHGFEGDCAISKGYVCDKYVRDRHHYVDMVAWCETIDGYIFSENYFVIELPSRKVKG